jgi:four helix bundle protein
MKEFNVISDCREMILLIYRIQFPSNETYGLMSQSRRSSVSVLLNLVEGNSYRDGNRNVLFNKLINSKEAID